MVPPLPPFPAEAKTFYFAFLAELGNLESFETILFFSKNFPLTSNPAGGKKTAAGLPLPPSWGDLAIVFKFSFIKVYLKYSTYPVILKILKQMLFRLVSKKYLNKEYSGGSAVHRHFPPPPPKKISLHFSPN